MDLFLPTNCYSKDKIQSVDGAVIHFISAKNVAKSDPFNREAILNIFKEYRLSAHYLIERDGTQINLVPDLHKAYHAGFSRMNGRNSCNNFTVGIELVGGSDWDYVEEQIISLSTLLAQLMTKHNFSLDSVQGHDEIRANWIKEYPDKAKIKKVDSKYDPGKHFPWRNLRAILSSVA